MTGPCRAEPDAASAPQPLVEHPAWVRLPTARDIADVYPPEAESRRISGGAVITCTITDKGLLTACQVISETPSGRGFGAAALKLAPLFKMRLTSKDGQPVAGGMVRLPIGMQVWD